MKIRNGFISNSSSSSFIVAFDKKPTHAYELMEILFPENKNNEQIGVNSPYEAFSIDPMSASTIIWNQLENQNPLNKSEILEKINSGWFDGHPEYDIYNKPELKHISDQYTKETGKNIFDKDADEKWVKKYNDASNKIREEYIKEVKNAAKKLFDTKWEIFKNKKCFLFTFSDNDGEIFSTLEHGDTFRNVPNIRISYH